jgi:predicted enzyme related to lactoylglutathione lyase
MAKVERTFFVPDLDRSVQFFESLRVFRVEGAGYPRAFVGFPKESPTFVLDISEPHTAEERRTLEAQTTGERRLYHFYLDQFEDWEEQILSAGLPVHFASNLPLGTLASTTDPFGNVFTFSPNPAGD